MSIEKQEETIIEPQENNEEIEETTEVEETEEEESKPKGEKKESKPKRSPEEELAYFEGRADRLRKKLGKNSETHEEKPSQKSDDLDYGQKAFLRSYDVKGADEIALVKSYMATGKSIDDIVENKHFKNDLSDLREARATRDATPKGSKRGTAPVGNDESSWLAKIENGSAKLGDIEDVDMRRKVLNKQIEKEKVGSKFSPNGIVRG